MNLLLKGMQLFPRLRPQLFRFGFNWHRAYRRTGGNVIDVSHDLMQMKIALALNRHTQNIFGSLFGGSLYAITDGPYPAMMMAQLGENFVAWDKSGAIRYRRPAYETIYCICALEHSQLPEIRSELAQNGETERTFIVELKDRAGVVYAIVERTVFIAHKDHMRKKRQQK